MYKKSLAPFGNETQSKNNYHTKYHRKILPPYGKYYEDLRQSSSGTINSVYLIYVSLREPIEIAKISLSLGLTPPVILNPFVDASEYRWNVSGINVEIVMLEKLIPSSYRSLVQELIKSNAMKVTIKYPDGDLPLRGCVREVVYE